MQCSRLTYRSSSYNNPGPVSFYSSQVIRPASQTPSSRQVFHKLHFHALAVSPTLSSPRSPLQTSLGYSPRYGLHVHSTMKTHGKIYQESVARNSAIPATAGNRVVPSSQSPPDMVKAAQRTPPHHRGVMKTRMNLVELRTWLYQADVVTLQEFNQHLAPWRPPTEVLPLGLAASAITACQKALAIPPLERVDLAFTLLLEAVSTRPPEHIVGLGIFNDVLRVMEKNGGCHSEERVLQLLQLIERAGLKPDSRIWFKVTHALCAHVGAMPGLESMAVLYNERESNVLPASMFLPIARQYLKDGGKVTKFVEEVVERGHAASLVGSDGFQMLLRAACEGGGHRSGVKVLALMRSWNVPIENIHLGLLLEACFAEKMDANTAHQLVQGYEAIHGNLLGLKGLKQMLQMCNESANVDLAEHYLARGQHMGLDMDTATAVHVLRCYSTANRQKDGTQRLLQWEAQGSIVPKHSLFRALLLGYAHKGDADGVEHLLRMMDDRNLLVGPAEWSYLICAYCKRDEVEKAMEVMGNMAKKGTRINGRTYMLLAVALTRRKDHRLAAELIDKMKYNGDMPTLALYNPLIRIYGFQQDSARLGEVVRSMQAGRVSPDQYTKVALLGALGHLHSVDDVNLIVQTIHRTPLRLTTTMFNSLLRLLSFTSWFDALSLYKKMLSLGISPDVHTYTVLVTACIQGGHCKRAARLFQTMKTEGMCAPDSKLYNALMTGYAQWGEATAVKELMD
eukprot:Ihof_evm1s658 gene=Ihof_evmTU1s658